MTALVIGASGATGRDLIDQLLEDSNFREVHIFVRKPFASNQQKLITHIVDFEKQEEWKELVKGDVAFSCMGTSLKAAGSKEAQRKVDYDYQYNFAKAARENDVEDHVLISAYGANASSSFFYPKIKGELEKSVEKLNFKRTIIFRPGILVRKNTTRLGEAMSEKIIKIFNFIGLFKKFKPLPTNILAKAMINSLDLQPNGITVIKLDKIFNVGGINP